MSPLDDVESVRRRDPKLGVVGAEMTGYGPGVRCFVETLLAIPDRESADASAALRLHHGHDRRRSDATGQERAHRHIGGHLQTDSVAQQHIEAVDSAGFAEIETVVLRLRSDLCRIGRRRRCVRPSAGGARGARRGNTRRIRRPLRATDADDLRPGAQSPPQTQSLTCGDRAIRRHELRRPWGASKPGPVA